MGGMGNQPYSFGAVAVGLEMIPIANLLFMWTNIVGCALWVADEIERDERHQQQIAQAVEQQQLQQQQLQQQQHQGGRGSESAVSSPDSPGNYSPPNTTALLGSNPRQHQYQQLGEHQPVPVQKGLTMMPAHRKQ